MKIGIFAGTFDPIHDGHLAFATAASEKVGLEKVILVAEKEPYRKKPYAAWDHRQAMLERATQDTENIDHDYQFAAELSHQHTVLNMLRVAKKHYGSDNQFWFLIGSDVIEHMHRWEELADANEYGGFVVALRSGHSEQWLKDQQAKMIQRGFQPHLVLIPSPKPLLGSTKVRESIAKHEPTDFLPVSVQSYIAEHNLYQAVK